MQFEDKARIVLSIISQPTGLMRASSFSSSMLTSSFPNSFYLNSQRNKGHNALGKLAITHRQVLSARCMYLCSFCLSHYIKQILKLYYHHLHHRQDVNHLLCSVFTQALPCFIHLFLRGPTFLFSFSLWLRRVFGGSTRPASIHASYTSSIQHYNS